jgi:dihydrofolate reductase
MIQAVRSSTTEWDKELPKELPQRFALVVAHDSKLGIGKNNTLPWAIPQDLRVFRKLTTSVADPVLMNAVIMGRKTWQSVPCEHIPLKGRINLVLTHDRHFAAPPQVLVCPSLDRAISQLESLAFESCFVIGGASVYQQAMANRRFGTIYVTEVCGDFKCDVFFPEYRDDFALVKQSQVEQDGRYSYQFNVYMRKETLALGENNR